MSSVGKVRFIDDTADAMNSVGIQKSVISELTYSLDKGRSILSDLTGQMNQNNDEYGSNNSSLGFTTVMEEFSVSDLSCPTDTTGTTTSGSPQQNDGELISPLSGDDGDAISLLKTPVNAKHFTAAGGRNETPIAARIERLRLHPGIPPPSSSSDDVDNLMLHSSMEKHLRKLHDDIVQSTQLTLFYISRFEVELQRLRLDFSTIVQTLQEENKTLKMELERRPCFY